MTRTNPPPEKEAGGWAYSLETEMWHSIPVDQNEVERHSLHKTKSLMITGNEPTYPWVTKGTSGLTLRQYYAGLFMQGLVSNPIYDPNIHFMHYAADAIKATDALIEALNKPQTNE